MTITSNDSGWWSLISYNRSFSYWIVAAGVVVVYDWAMTLGQEIELIWRQRWSLMTVLYLVMRYAGTLYYFISFLTCMPLVSLTDAGCNIIGYALNGSNVIEAAMLGIIMIARLHAMYQGSRIMLVFLVVIWLAINIACGAITAIALKDVVAEELILSGIHICNYSGNVELLFSMVWVLNAVWEVLALCLSVWIAVKHFRSLRRLNPSTGSTIEDCFRVLIKSHVLYFASFTGVSCLQFVMLSPEFSSSISVGAQIIYGALQMLTGVQSFVLGPRLILSVREHHAKIVTNSDAETSMKSIVFQERVHISTSSTV